jgi:ATP-dependent Clp protease ATP-binding subunit ClpA
MPKSRPYSVVLLDEIEKAHPRVYDLFLQVFDDGRLTDAKGRTADARNAIFIMTSNIASAGKVGFRQTGAEQPEATAFEALRKRFRPEFINRIHDVIVFRPLAASDIRKILRPMLDEISGNLKQRYGCTLHVTETAEEYLAQAGYNPDFGARELRRTVERLLEVPLSSLIVSGRLKDHSHWEVALGDGKITIVPVVWNGETL